MTNTRGRVLRPLVIMLAALLLQGCITWEHPGYPTEPPTPVDPTPPPAPEPSPVTGIESFDGVENGMTEVQVTGRMGDPDEIPQEVGPDRNLQWTVEHEGSEFVAFVTFSNGRVIGKRLVRVKVAP